MAYDPLAWERSFSLIDRNPPARRRRRSTAKKPRPVSFKKQFEREQKEISKMRENLKYRRKLTEVRKEKVKETIRTFPAELKAGVGEKVTPITAVVSLARSFWKKKKKKRSLYG